MTWAGSVRLALMGALVAYGAPLIWGALVRADWFGALFAFAILVWALRRAIDAD